MNAIEYAIQWMNQRFSWHIREYHLWKNGLMTTNGMEEVETIYDYLRTEDKPIEVGWYGIIHSSDSASWSGTSYWDGKTWSDTYPGYRSAKPLNTKEDARDWASKRCW